MKIVLSTLTLKPEVGESLAQVGGKAIAVVHDEAATIAALADADGFMVSDNAYTTRLAAAIGSAPKLRWLQILTAGYDNATRIGVPGHLTVSNVGDAFSPSVAVHAVALLLGLQRGLPQMLANQPRHVWDKTLAARMVMPEGRTLLIVGFGSIGREIARLVAPLGMRVIGISRSGTPHPLAAEVHTSDALMRLLPHADAIVIAVPLSPTTTGLIGAKELAVCKPSALLINIARGKLVDSSALADALIAGRLGGAGLDVTEPEPLPAGHRLWTAPNTIISPHVGGAAGPYGTLRQIERASANLRRYMAGEPVENRIVP